jgi:hypothetical protein
VQGDNLIGHFFIALAHEPFSQLMLDYRRNETVLLDRHNAGEILGERAADEPLDPG